MNTATQSTGCLGPRSSLTTLLPSSAVSTANVPPSSYFSTTKRICSPPNRRDRLGEKAHHRISVMANPDLLLLWSHLARYLSSEFYYSCSHIGVPYRRRAKKQDTNYQ